MDSIIFDVDGTLWDSTEIVARSWSDYLQTEEHMDRTLTANLLSSLMAAARQNTEHCSKNVRPYMKTLRKPLRFCPPNILCIS